MQALVTLGELLQFRGIDLEEDYWAETYGQAYQVRQLEERIAALIDGRMDVSSYVDAELKGVEDVTDEDRKKLEEELRQSLIYVAEAERAQLLSLDVAVAIREQEKEESKKEKLLRRCVRLLWEDDSYVGSYLRGKVLWQRSIDEEFLSRFIGFCSIEFNGWPGVEIDSKVRFTEKPIARGHETIEVINTLEFPGRWFRVREYRTSNRTWYFWKVEEKGSYYRMYKSALRHWQRYNPWTEAFRCLKKQVEGEIRQLKAARAAKLKRIRQDINELYVYERRRNERSYQKWLSIVRRWWCEYRKWKKDLKKEQQNLIWSWRKNLSREVSKNCRKKQSELLRLFRKRVKQLKDDVRMDLCLCRRRIAEKSRNLWTELEVEEVIYTKSTSEVFQEKKQFWERYREVARNLYSETDTKVKEAYDWLWHEAHPALRELEKRDRQRFLKHVRQPLAEDISFNRAALFGKMRTKSMTTKRVRDTRIKLFRVPVKWVREGDCVINFIPRQLLGRKQSELDEVPSSFLVATSRFHTAKRDYVWMEEVPTPILEKKAWLLLDHIWNSKAVLDVETGLKAEEIAVLIKKFRNSNVLNDGLPILGKARIVDRCRKERLARELRAA